MGSNLIKAYYRTFGNKYHQEDIFRQYPETRLIPAYLRTHFADARVVLDLGFGTGLWFWATFLSSLERLDGIDASPEALEEADRVFDRAEVPAGYRLAHAEKYQAIDEIFRASGMRVVDRKRAKSGDTLTCTWWVTGAPHKHEILEEKLLAHPDVRELTV
jgi:ubiquinone/menaquinone biosynthesis C-methylase UbiE